QRYLIQQIRVDPASITRHLKRLEAEGYVERASDARDNRYTRVRLSAKGSDYVGQLRAERDAFIDRMLEGMAPADVQIMLRTLDRISANLGVDTALPP